jgi:hypothetical protein
MDEVWGVSIFLSNDRLKTKSFSSSADQMFNRSKVHSFVVKLCLDGNNVSHISHVILNYVSLCDNKTGMCISRYEK